MTVQEDFSALFRRTHSKFSRLYARVLGRLDLSLPQYALLNLLAAQGPLSMTEISRELFITKPAVTNLVDRLERRKFLKRESDASDRRVSRLAIQPKGRKVAEEVQSETLGLCVKALGQCSPAQIQAMTRFHDILHQSIDRKLAEGPK